MLDDLTETTPVRCLVVDDEPRLRHVLLRLMRAEGYSCREAGNGAHALTLLEQEPAALVLTDLRMPQMDGPAFFAWLQRERPQLARRAAFVTGDTLGIEAVRFLAKAGRPFMEKPFTRASLKRLLAELAETAQ